SAANGHVEVVKLLLNANANIEAVDNEYGRTPLSLAAENGHVDVVKLLLNVNANIEAVDIEYGRTPLSLAAENGHVDVVKLLSNANVNIEAASKYGRIPLSELKDSWKRASWWHTGDDAQPRTLVQFPRSDQGSSLDERESVGSEPKDPVRRTP